MKYFAVIYKNLVCGAKTAGCVYESQDGMIAAFLGKGLSEVQIRSFLPVGGREYVRAIFPNVRLSRAKEDECDTCVAINIELADESILEERRQELLLL